MSSEQRINMYQNNDVAGASPALNVMIMAAEKAAKSLVRDFGEVEHLQVSVKGPGDFVTNADRKAEKILIQELQKARPKYGFMIEESGEIIGEDPDFCWIIDPLDGTTNFMHGIPHFAISIALEKRGDIISALVFDPIKNELFTAEKGKGTIFNKRKTRVSGRDKLPLCLIGTGLSCHNTSNTQEAHDRIKAVTPHVASIRSSGSIALDMAYLAVGRLDGFWRNNFQSWDVAAGMLLLQEAGGMLSSLNGEAFDFDSQGIIASNGKIQNNLISLIND